MDQELLNGQVAVLVGVGAAGDVPSNGRATALAFAGAGATVVLVDKSQQALEACAEAVAQAGGNSATYRCDVTDEAAVASVSAQILRDHGAVDLLHNNLGIAPAGRLPKVTPEQFDRVMAVNVKSVAFLCKHLLPAMEKRRRGVITNVSSISSLRHLGIPSPLYDMSKAALNALTRHIAAEYGAKGIRANTLVLGMMDTPLARGAIERAGKERASVYDGYLEKIPAGRMGTAEDTARVATFLASDWASYVNGAEIVVDGGLCIRAA